ncbi:MAG TPA: hypothetical protein ENH40_03155, partial [Nitrospirae bacterium]|nr:hypothetical protein [Nitrospirota bacterium]
IYEADYWTVPAVREEAVEYHGEAEIEELRAEMKKAAEKLDFEKAAGIRDRIKAIRKKQLELGMKE